MQCPECQSDNRQEAKFCDECGCKLISLSEASGTTTELEAPTDQPPRKIEFDDVDLSVGERKHVTVLFSDLTGYTAISEKLDPEEVKEITGTIFSKLTKIIEKYDGFIEKYIGDAILAVFGAKEAFEDSSLRAIKAAREIHAYTDALSPKYEEIIGCQLSMHTGINTGLVVTGEINYQKGTHGLVGDTINTAARLMSVSQPGEIVIDHDSYVQTKGYFEFDALEPVQVKGKAKPIIIYRVGAALQMPKKLHRLHGRRAELIGRSIEMQILKNAAKSLEQGIGSVVSVCGAAGTGKSRLVHDFRKTLGLDKFRWFDGNAYPHTQNMPYYPLINLLSRAFQIDDEDLPETIKRKVESSIAILLGDKNEYAPYIGGLFALTYPENDKVSPEFWKSKLQESIRAILSSLFERDPTIFCLEDLHWGDSSFLELLQLILERYAKKALFICTYRPPFKLFENETPNNIVGCHHIIRLKELSAIDSHSMLKSLLNDEFIPKDLQEFVRSKTDGNPFYLEEMINSLIENEILIRVGRKWKLERNIRETDIPPTINGMLMARVDRLGENLKRILQEASVIGRYFLFKILEKITNIRNNLSSHLSDLENLDLIRTKSFEPELEYIFKHALTQEVVYNGLLKTERKIIHERIGIIIEQIFKDRLPEFCETLAYHFKQSQLDDKAVKYLIMSGEKSLKLYAVEESHKHYEEAFQILKINPLEYSKKSDIIIDLLIKWALVYYYRGDFRGLVKKFEAHEALTISLKNKTNEGLFYAWLGFALYARHKYKAAYKNLTKALRIGEEHNCEIVIGYSSTWLTYLCGDLGLFDNSLMFAEKALKIANSIKSDYYLFFKPLGGVAQTSFYLGDTGKAYNAGSLSLSFGEENSNTRSIVMGHIGLGISYFVQGKLNSAIEQFKAAVEVSADPFYRQVANYSLGAAYVLNDNFADAEPVLQEVRSYGEKYGCEWASIPADLFFGVIQIASGKMSFGLQLVNESLSKFIAAGRKPYVAMSEYVLGKIFYMMMYPKDPIDIFTILKNLFFIIKNRPFASKKAEIHFLKAISLAEKINAKGILGQAYLDMGYLKKKQNRLKEAKEYFSLAISILQECGAESPVKEAKSALSSL